MSPANEPGPRDGRRLPESEQQRASERPDPVLSAEDAIRRLFGRGSVYALVVAIQMLSGFLVMPALTRLLAPTAYGQIAAALVVYLAVSIIASAGLPDAAARRFFAPGRPPANASREARRLIASLLWIAPLVALAADLTGQLWANPIGMHYGAVLRLAVWCGAAGALLAGAQALLRVAERVWAFLTTAVVAAVGGQGLGLGLAVVQRSPSAYMAGVTIGTALGAAVGLLATGTLRVRPARPAELRRGLGLGLPMVPHSLAVSMLASADRILIVALLGLRSAGRYQVAYAVGGVGVAIITALNQAWIPLSLGTRSEQRWPILLATSRVVLLAAGVVAAVLSLLAPLALLVAAPASYGRAGLVSVVALVAFSAVPYASCSTYFQVVFVSGRTRIMALAAPVAAAANVGINLALLHPLGLVGAALATLAAYTLLPVIVAVRARRLVPLPGAARDAAAACLLTAPFVTAGAFLPPNPAGVIGRVAAGLVIAALIPPLLRAVRPASPSVPSSPQPVVPASR